MQHFRSVCKNTYDEFFTGLMSYFSSDIFGPREVILTEYLIGNQDA